jgi:hypothetical protein
MLRCYSCGSTKVRHICRQCRTIFCSAECGFNPLFAFIVTICTACVEKSQTVIPTLEDKKFTDSLFA